MNASTAVLAVDTPRGTRYRGVSFTSPTVWTAYQSMRRPVRRLPARSTVLYQSPLRVSFGDAFDLARSHTIRHNVSLPVCGHCGEHEDAMTVDATGTLSCYGCWVPDITQPRYRGATEDFIVPAPGGKA